MTEQRKRALTITCHAVGRYSRRRNLTPALQALEDVDWKLNKLKRVGYTTEDLKHLIDLYNELDAEIRQCVSYALAERMTLKRKPEGFVLYGQKPEPLPPGHRFVRCSEDSNYGFIVKREEEHDIVVTTLTRAGVRR